VPCGFQGRNYASCRGARVLAHDKRFKLLKLLHGLADGNLYHHYTAAGEKLEESIGRKSPQRFARRRPWDIELAAKIELDNTLPRLGALRQEPCREEYRRLLREAIDAAPMAP
jgi:hypothetical protein